MNKKNIYFSELFFYPEGWSGARLSNDIVSKLQRNYYSLNVICSHSSYTNLTVDSTIADPRKLGVKIKRVHNIFKDSKTVSKKIINDLYFCLKTFKFFILSKKPSLFITQTNPPLIVSAASLAASLRGVPLIIIAMDLYPEVINSYYKNKIPALTYYFLKTIFNMSYKKASKVISLGPFMSKRISQKGVYKKNIYEISNWATGKINNQNIKENKLIDKFEIRNKFPIVYSGNLGLSHDWESLIHAIEKIKDNDKFKLIFISQKSKSISNLKMYVVKNNLSERVGFYDLVPEYLLPQSMALTKLAVVTIKPSFSGLVVPSKFLGYIARGIPVLYIGPDSDISYHIKRGDCGFSFKNYQIKEISDFINFSISNKEILKKKGINGKNYYINHLSKEIGCNKYLKVVNKIVSSNES